MRERFDRVDHFLYEVWDKYETKFHQPHPKLSVATIMVITLLAGSFCEQRTGQSSWYSTTTALSWGVTQLGYVMQAAGDWADPSPKLPTPTVSSPTQTT